MPLGPEAKAAAALVSEARVGELLQKLGGRGTVASPACPAAPAPSEEPSPDDRPPLSQVEPSPSHIGER